MRLKAVVPSSYDLNSRWVVNQKYSNCQWTWTPWLDPHVPFMCNCRDFRQGMGGGHRLCHFLCLPTVRAQVWPRQIATVWNWRYFWFYFHKHFLETKAPIRPAVRRLVWAFVVRMYQRRISRDKVHTLFKNSKLNVKIYTRYTPRRLCRGVFSFRLSVCPLVLSYVG